MCAGLDYPDLLLPIRNVYSIGISEIERFYYIIATNDDAQGQKGIVQIIRVAIDGVEQSLLLKDDFWNSDRKFYEAQLKYVCDLNRDGKPELITYMTGLGETVWGSYQVYSLQNNHYTEVLVAGWFD